MKIVCANRGCRKKFEKKGRRLYCSNACKQQNYRNKNCYDSVRALTSSESENYYTPPLYVEAVKQVLDVIDLDPASCEEANEIVKATTYYTKSQNGLLQKWHGRVFCNPPYKKTNNVSNQSLFLQKAIEEYETGNITQCILLLSATVSNKWFQKVWDYPLCITNHRINFIKENGIKSRSSTIGNVFVYLGQNPVKFRAIFSQYGTIIEP